MIDGYDFRKFKMRRIDNLTGAQAERERKNLGSKNKIYHTISVYLIPRLRPLQESSADKRIKRERSESKRISTLVTKINIPPLHFLELKGHLTQQGKSVPCSVIMCRFLYILDV